jgi:membrane-associated phospholipid phosphatase
VIALPALFWLVMLKRTTERTAPEEWLMANVVPQVHDWVQTNLPLIETLIVGVSGLGSGWFVALAFSGLGLLALSRGRRDLAFLMALGMLCFPMEWALKYFTSAEAISLPALVAAIFNVNDIGLDDIADFPAGHALRATVLYGLTAFSIARLASDERQGRVAYAAAAVIIAAISGTRIYLGAHFPIDVVGGWMAGGALLAILVAVHILRVDERARAREAAVAVSRRAGGRRIAVPLHHAATPPGAPADPGEG